MIMNLFTFIRNISILKTICFNFNYFAFKDAIRLPAFIYRRTKINSLKGKIIIKSDIKTGMIRLGMPNLGNQDLKYSRTIWDVKGKIVISGDAIIGRGSKISIGKDGILFIGKHFTITGCSDIICHKSITFGDDCLLAWDILMMDTDFHLIQDEKGNIINSPKPIVIGNHVWIGCRSTILKGVSIPNNNIVASNSVITKTFEVENCVIGGHGATAGIIKRNVNWLA
jgi:acetyltransferase-like isoleucine patch superfamily enzyme